MRDRRYAVLIGAVALLVATSGVFGSAAAGTSGSDTVTVTDVVDGDTIDIRYDNGSTDTVRLLGVDAPEDGGQNYPREFEGVPRGTFGANCLSDEGGDSTAFMKQLEGKTVTLEYDSEADRRGDFGRLLAYVHYDGEDYNYKLVRTGRARVYDSTFSRSDSYYDAESEAQSVNRDLWRCRNAEPGDIGEVDIEVINEDPAGADGDNLNEEYVVLENSASGYVNPVDLSGWTVSDGNGSSYTFPEGTVLQAGATITLHTGSGSASLADNYYDQDVYWNRSQPVWNNDGDVVNVTADDGRLATSRLVD